MKHLRRLHMAGCLVTAAIALLALRPIPAVAAPGPGATAVGYLQARAAAVTATDPAASLAHWLTPGSALLAREKAVAAGTARRAGQMGHIIDSVAGRVVVRGARVDAGGTAATVSAHVVTTTLWHATGGARSREASGVDHSLSLERLRGAWHVVADTYSDVQVPAELEAAGAPEHEVRACSRRLEKAAATLHVPRPGSKWATPPRLGRRYTDVIVYDRNACAAYADRYALSYNPTFVHFGADCANFGSQCGLAGGMPLAGSSWESGWWYFKNGTSSPSDDTYSLSWINVPKQMGFWNGRRTHWAKSIGRVGKGDFVYYDWTGDGTWDHVAVLVGTNSVGQKVVDAHTTDHYRVFWKLGSASTCYRFARVRSSWVI